MKKSVPNLPASSKLQPPSGGGPSIKGALKAKPLAMSGGVPSKSAKSVASKGGVAKSLVKKLKK
jgi:hypothetical protein